MRAATLLPTGFMLMLAALSSAAVATPRSRPAHLMRPARLIADFETALEGWQTGENTAGLAVVRTSVSAQAALHRDYLLELDTLTVAGNLWRGAFREISPPLDVRRAPYLILGLASYDNRHPGVERGDPGVGPEPARRAPPARANDPGARAVDRPHRAGLRS